MTPSTQDDTDLDTRVKRVAVPTGKPTHGDWVFLAQMNEGLLDKEIVLASTRVNWMMTSQSILFGTFWLILINKEKSPDAARLLLSVIPFLAIVIIIAALVGFVAAQVVIHKLERERSFYQSLLSKMFAIAIPDIGYRRQGWWLSKTRFCGFIPSVVVTIVLLLVWILVLLARLKIAINIGDL